MSTPQKAAAQRPVAPTPESPPLMATPVTFGSLRLRSAFNVSPKLLDLAQQPSSSPGFLDLRDPEQSSSSAPPCGMHAGTRSRSEPGSAPSSPGLLWKPTSVAPLSGVGGEDGGRPAGDGGGCGVLRPTALSLWSPEEAGEGVAEVAMAD